MASKAKFGPLYWCDHLRKDLNITLWLLFWYIKVLLILINIIINSKLNMGAKKKDK
jgi:hypothetical protein